MNRSWKIVLALLIALTASTSTLGAGTDFTLGIFGNANMDDTIDEKDVAYVEGVIKGTNAATNLSDANYDGKVDALDIDQIKLIMGGEEKKLTVKDKGGNAITISEPVRRIVFCGTTDPDMIRLLHAEDKAVGTGEELKILYSFSFPELSKLPSIGPGSSPDYEAILSLHPDVFFITTSLGAVEDNKLPGITLVRLPLLAINSSGYKDSIAKLGYILDARDKAEEYINWSDYWTDKIKAQVAEIPDKERPRVAALDTNQEFRIFTTKSSNHERIITAGGKNVAEDLDAGDASVVSIEPEWLIERNPDIILIHISESGIHGYAVNNTTNIQARRDDFMNRPEFANLTAVKTGKVYLHSREIIYGAGGGVTSVAYFAKLFYPDLFKDLDPQSIHQEYLTRFLHMDYDLEKQGAFVYPPLNES